MNKRVTQTFQHRWRWVAIGAGLAVTAAIGLGMVLLTWITVALAQHCHLAQSRFEGDCVAAEIELLQDDQASFSDRNMAIWTLGQIADDRARATLESLYTGVIPESEPLDAGISQYELRKALKNLEQGPPMSSIVWRLIR